MTAKIIRACFLLTFVFLTVRGVYLTYNRTEYIPEKPHNAPVFATVYANDISVTGAFSYGKGKEFPTVSALAAAVISADSGEALYLKNADTPLPMASTTKIMTALTVIENTADISRTVNVPQEACGIEGSSIYLVPGEKITVKDLLYGLLLESGNDAAEALAVTVGGSRENFVSLMNRRAGKMGLTVTEFDNPHGLSSENHRTSARELALIAYHAMKIPLFREIVGTKDYTVKDENGNAVRYFSNHNRLLRTYSGATGIKTGYTIASGRCLVTSAARDGSEFIAVTLNDRNDFADHKAMLDYAFENYITVNVAEENEISAVFSGVEFTNSERVCFCAEKEREALCASILLTASAHEDIG